MKRKLCALAAVAFAASTLGAEPVEAPPRPPNAAAPKAQKLGTNGAAKNKPGSTPAPRRAIKLKAY